MSDKPLLIASCGDPECCTLEVRRLNSSDDLVFDTKGSRAILSADQVRRLGEELIKLTSPEPETIEI